MNNYVVGGLCFVVGAALGAGVGIRLTVKKIDAQYEELVQQELDSIRESFEHYGEKKVGKATAEANKDMAVYEKKVDEYIPHPGMNVRAEEVYEELMKKEELTEAEKQEHPGKEEIEPIPYLISEVEMSEEKVIYDKITLSYYEEDDVLVDEREEMVHNADELLGQQPLLYFAEHDNPDDPDCIRIRNENLMADFEVCVVHGKYEDVIMGGSRG